MLKCYRFALAICTTVLFIWTIPVFAQVDTAWVRRFNGSGNGGDIAYAIAVDDSGSVCVTGQSDGIGTDVDYATIKYYPNGDTAWVRRYNGPGNGGDYPWAIAVDDLGDVYVTGESVGSGTSWDCATIKYHPNGDTAWVRRYNGPANSYDGGFAIVVDDSSYVYITGTSYDSGTAEDYLTIKYRPNGDTVWLRRYNGPADSTDFAYGLAVDNSGNVYVTGASTGNGTSFDYATIKYLPNGDTAWVRRYNGTGNNEDIAFAIDVDSSGNIYVNGQSWGQGTYQDYATIKYYPDGDTAWVRRYDDGNSTDNVAWTIALDDSGSVYVTGNTSQGCTTIKYHTDGDTAWVRRYNGPGSNNYYASYLAVDGSGNVYVTGSSGEIHLPNIWYDYATIKYYPNGDTAWVRTYSGPGLNDDYAKVIMVDDSANVYVTGYSAGDGTDMDYATIKYVQSNFEPSPHVVSASPTQNQLNVPVNSNISVTFDIDMDPTTLNDSTCVVNAWSTGLHQGTITYDSPTKTATLNPNADFDEGEIVTVVLTTGIKSSVGTPMDSSYVWSFTTKADDGTACFAPAINYSTGDASVSVFCADLDGDGDLDLAVTNWFGNNVSILKNNGDGTFQVAVNYVTGSYPTAVFCADMDGDNDLDLAVANYGSDNVSIFKNVGDGTFQNATNYATGASPTSVFCADLDGDNDLDLAVANCGSDSISIFENNGDGTFQAAVNYEAGACPLSLFCADVNGDNDLDLAVANNWSDSVSILMNNGDGTFQNKIDYGTGAYPRSVFCADLDEDGDLDLAVANQAGSNVSILKNNGDGTFQDTVNYGAGNGPWSVFCADLDGDDALDLAVANAGDGVSILRNNGDGTFQAAVNYAAGDGPFSVFCADVDGDNDLDLTVANYYSDNVSVLLNIRRGDCTGDELVDAGDVVFLVNYLYRSGTAPNPLEIGDVTCDGVVDVGDVVYLINYLYKGGPVPCC